MRGQPAARVESVNVVGAIGIGATVLVVVAITAALHTSRSLDSKKGGNSLSSFLYKINFELKYNYT
jgi:hypothetical protein